MAGATEKFSNYDKLMTLLAVSAKLVLESVVQHLQLVLGRLRKPEQ